jgi:hypothetical protein
MVYRGRTPGQLLEAIAAIEHEQWCAWAYAVMREENLSQDRIDRWNRLLITPYDQLTEQEKEQDREWARKVRALIEVHDH